MFATFDTMSLSLSEMYNIFKGKHSKFQNRTYVGKLNTTEWYPAFRVFLKREKVFAVDAEMRSSSNNGEVMLLSITAGRMEKDKLRCITWVIWYDNSQPLPVPIREFYESEKMKVTYYCAYMLEEMKVKNLMDLQKHVMVKHYTTFKQHYTTFGELLSLANAITYLTPFVKMARTALSYRKKKDMSHIVLAKDDISQKFIWLSEDSEKFTKFQEGIVVGPSFFTLLLYVYMSSHKVTAFI
jgi:hypothetical protein